MKQMPDKSDGTPSDTSSPTPHTEGVGDISDAPLIMASTVVSDVGYVRSSNQDSGFAGSYLIAMADGMGGHAGGDTACTIVIRTLSHFERQRNHDSQDINNAAITLKKSILAAHDAIVGQAKRHPELTGMGTTIDAVVLVDNHWILAHIGDSRAYLLRNGVLIELTKDHSYVQHLLDTGRITEQEAKNHPQRSIVIRVLGDFDINPYPDLSIHKAYAGDRWLLCSDGLSGPLSDEIIHDVMVNERNREACTQKLVNMALKAGSTDNVTAVVADAIPLPQSISQSSSDTATGNILLNRRNKKRDRENIKNNLQIPLIAGAAEEALDSFADIVRRPVAIAPALIDEDSPALKAALLNDKDRAALPFSPDNPLSKNHDNNSSSALHHKDSENKEFSSDNTDDDSYEITDTLPETEEEFPAINIRENSSSNKESSNDSAITTSAQKTSVTSKSKNYPSNDRQSNIHSPKPRMFPNASTPATPVKAVASAASMAGNVVSNVAGAVVADAVKAATDASTRSSSQEPSSTNSSSLYTSSNKSSKTDTNKNVASSHNTSSEKKIADKTSSLAPSRETTPRSLTEKSSTAQSSKNRPANGQSPKDRSFRDHSSNIPHTSSATSSPSFATTSSNASQMSRSSQESKPHLFDDDVLFNEDIFAGVQPVSEEFLKTIRQEDKDNKDLPINELEESLMGALTKTAESLDRNLNYENIEDNADTRTDSDKSSQALKVSTSNKSEKQTTTSRISSKENQSPNDNDTSSDKISVHSADDTHATNSALDAALADEAELLSPTTFAIPSSEKAESAAAVSDTTEIPIVKAQNGAIITDPDHPQVKKALSKEAEAKKRANHRASIRLRWIWGLIIGSFFILIIAAGITVWQWSQSHYYVGEKDGYITIYKGVPTNIFGWHLSHEVERTQVPVNELPPTLKQQIAQGTITAPSIYEVKLQTAKVLQQVLDQQKAELINNSSSDSTPSSGSTSTPSTTDPPTPAPPTPSPSANSSDTSSHQPPAALNSFSFTSLSSSISTLSSPLSIDSVNIFSKYTSR